MAETAHTPGPWVPVELHIGSRSFWIAINSGGKLPETEANARLIAAAPDMLAALKRIASHDLIGLSDPYRTIMQDMIDAANAAIAKAEGR